MKSAIQYTPGQNAREGSQAGNHMRVLGNDVRVRRNDIWIRRNDSVVLKNY